MDLQQLALYCCVICCMCRLRDLSAQDKQEYQRVMKDLDKASTELNQLKEQKEKMAQDLQV